MKLISLFQKLECAATDETFNALPISSNAEHRLAKTSEGFPVIMIRAKQTFENNQRFSLQNLKIQQNVECSIKESGETKTNYFTLIFFTNASTDLQSYFLRIAEPLLNSLPPLPTEKAVTDVIFKFIEIFKALSQPAHKSVLGLWGELLIISENEKPEMLITAWHNDPFEKFDFGADNWRIEVKTSVQNQRIHSFSLEQLNPSQEVEVKIASILTKQSVSGKSVQDLCDIIKAKVSDLDLIEKMNLTVAKTLGDTIREAQSLKFDIMLARQTLRFYSTDNIPKITSSQVPPQVSNVKFWVDLPS